MNRIDLAKYIDHTCLRPDATSLDIIKICREVNDYKFRTACVSLEKAYLASLHTRVAVVVGFPLGNTPTYIKTKETEYALDICNASEIDMVINIGRLKEKAYDIVFRDIKEVVMIVEPCAVKVIIETCLLTEEEKKAACLIAQSAGAKFIKTSTGFSKSGATIEDIKLIRRIVGNTMSIKASGGIKTLKNALNMIDAGADRIGTSSSVSIINEMKED
jgi:deoxyribose-phosphate aldolase